MSRSHILVVCTANICRSPLAERLLAEYFARNAEELDVHISSAGTHARPGDRAARGMRRIATDWDLDLGYHRSRRVDAELASQQTLVITMEDAHRSVVSRLAAGLGQRTFTITELDALVAARAVAAPEAPGLAAQVRAWHAARPRLSLDAPDVGDPYGGTPEEYERTARQLAQLVERLGPPLAEAAAGD